MKNILVYIYFTNRYNHQTIVGRIYCLLISVCHILRQNTWLVDF